MTRISRCTTMLTSSLMNRIVNGATSMLGIVPLDRMLTVSVELCNVVNPITDSFVFSLCISTGIMDTYNELMGWEKDYDGRGSGHCGPLPMAMSSQPQASQP